MQRSTMALLAGLLAFTPVAASAQNAAETPVDTSYGNPQPREDNDFPWGLLGLLGLAGLLGRKRRVDHVDVDNRTHR